MTPGVFILIGHSGAGKGTQAALLKEALEKHDSSIRTLYLESGRKFRELIATETYTAKQTRGVIAEGKLPPPFLGVHAWAHILIEEYDGASNLIIDGTPRVPDEVPILLSAARFYGWEPHVLYIDVSDEWAYEKTKGRGRSDDKDEHDVWGRIQWFHESVVPSLELLRASEIVHFHMIDGKQTIEKVHDDILTELALI